MNVNSPKPGKGLTLIEVLVFLAMSAVLVAFASPILRDNSARATIKEATVQVALALHNAKNSARASNTNVTVVLTTNPSSNTISFEFPGESANGATMPSLPMVTLPESISVSSDTPVLTFTPQGMVNTTATIQLASTTGTDFFAKVMLKSLQGRVKTYYGLHSQEEHKGAS